MLSQQQSYQAYVLYQCDDGRVGGNRTTGPRASAPPATHAQGKYGRTHTSKMIRTLRGKHSWARHGWLLGYERNSVDLEVRTISQSPKHCSPVFKLISKAA